ncbi:MAG: sugar phosphate isomerase/epimerase [Lentisphaerae bacterium]|jgi:sugar phosphate isomerase/epimerase|nr:sugar phosphate isomerase/epimerase [Lentisphaerota bacterium]MBT4820493.1 sugar phosphate isomerase/epimerase [Lentisphaerota bacterium]MBT5608771.1 sugar phosphate isomerase/epimerase [Lentisphaerota bacterium]MBT7058282.1 sugar phosphate isomerase/epimerase [Lentisphaerota bacterium]MBT7840257.1 sugar phosphate isomerase/epimerase [Lentisphaerota bacterium]
MKYCATTVAMPELTMAEQAGLLQKLGYDGVELRVRPVTDEQRKQGPSPWGYHVNDVSPENFAAKAAEIRSVLSDHGIALAGLATNVACTDLEQVKLVLEGAVAAGAPFFRVGAASGYNGTRPYREIYGETIAGYTRVLELTRGTGVKIVLEIHGNTIHPSASLAHRIVSQFDPQLVGVIYDPQNMVRDGFETTSLAIDLLREYIAHCHVGAHRPTAGEPDESGTASWKWERCRMAEGLYHFPIMLKELAAINYDGFISIEDFGSEPVEDKLADAIQYLRHIEP